MMTVKTLFVPLLILEGIATELVLKKNLFHQNEYISRKTRQFQDYFPATLFLLDSNSRREYQIWQRILISH